MRALAVGPAKLTAAFGQLGTKVQRPIVPFITQHGCAFMEYDTKGPFDKCSCSVRGKNAQTTLRTVPLNDISQ